MTTRERAGDRGRRRGEQLLDELLREIRNARVARNLSQETVGAAIGLSKSRISLIESGGYPDVPFLTVARLLGVVGLELSARAYPAGGGVRDAAQLALLERLRSRVSRQLVWRTEVAMPIHADQRAWDAALKGGGVRIGIDAETRLRDVQAVDRRVMLKLRDSGFDRAIILVAATRANRLTLRDVGPSMQANYPVPARSALHALAAGEDPGGNSVIVL